jgi:ubiquinone/menaquinone biosynthesis C-methylase UbiE
MGIYARFIFPRLFDWSMRNLRIADLRKQALSEVDGEILEIGLGTGLSLEHYPEHVRHLTAVDPGLGMARIARRRIEQSRVHVDLHVQTAEELPFGDGQFDCVVSTWTLCSIPGAQRAVSEIGRVLRPGGRFISALRRSGRQRASLLLGMWWTTPGSSWDSARRSS